MVALVHMQPLPRVSFQAYLSDMSKQGTWGDNVTLQVSN